MSFTVTSLEAPARATDQALPPSSCPVPGSAERSEKRPLVLVAEDDEIVALDMEQGLSAAGYDVAGPFPSCREMEAWLRDRTPDLAILDHVLRDGSCLEVARILRARAVPLLFCSLTREADSWSEFGEHPHVEKPFDIATLLNRAASLLRRA